MKRLTLAATAAAALLLGAAAYAQPSPGAGAPDAPRAEQRGQDRMERRAARMQERMTQRIERLKADLKLNTQQEALWTPLEAHLKTLQAERQTMRETMRGADIPERLDIMAERTAKAAANMQQLATLVKPFWVTLDEGQKRIVRNSLPNAGWGQQGQGLHGEGRGEGRGYGHGGRN